MRQNELREGVEVEDKDGNVIGTSKIAAWKVCIEPLIDDKKDGGPGVV